MQKNDWSSRIKSNRAKQRKLDSKANKRFKQLNPKRNGKTIILSGGMARTERKIKGHTWSKVKAKEETKFKVWNVRDTAFIRWAVQTTHDSINNY